MRTAGIVSLLAVAAACGGGGGSPPVKLKLKGQMERATPGTQATPLRLAMAWYPAFGGTGPAAPPGGVVTQDRVTFEGNFPLLFTFEVEGRPPAEALFDLSGAGGTGHIGYGVLIAYEDGNGNRTFDPIPAGGAPIDSIVGLSAPDPSRPPPPHSYFVVFLDGQPGPGDYWDAFSLEQGYNLLEVHSNFGVERISLESDVTIPITGTAALNLYACPDIFAAPGFLRQACGIDPYAGGYQAQGAVFATPTGTSAYVYVYDGGGNRADAAVTLDGADVLWSAYSEGYHWSSATTLSGLHTLAIAVPGHPTETLPFTLPEPLALLSPISGQALKSGTPVPISWTAAAGTAFYDIYFLTSDATGAWLFHDLPLGTAVTTPAIAHVGPARLSVKAIGTMGVGSQGSFVTPVSQVSADVTFTP